MFKSLACILAALFLLSPTLFAQEKGRFNLPDAPTKPRFKITDKTWPAQVGQADICLWHDDKLAALSLGVDDNIGGEIEWWKQQAAGNDVKVTWFVISGRVDRNTATGYWKQFQELNNLGFGVESHSVSHLHMNDPGWGGSAWTYDASLAETAKLRAEAQKNAEAAAAESDAAPGAKTEATEGAPAAKPAPADGKPAAGGAAKPAATARPVMPPITLSPEEIAKGMEWEYAQSKAQIDQHITGHQVSALAYPGGSYTKYNDRAIAAKVYRVARGAHGTANPANMTDYLSLNAQSSWVFDSAKYPWGNVNNLFDPKLSGGRYYRGWAVLFSHTVNKPLMAQTFDFIKANRDKLWIGLLVDVSKYGQERDTATLKVESPGPDKITFSLTDEMDDSYFNYPLTVKVRIPDAWKEVSAAQRDKPLHTQVLQHEGGNYVLVDAVPDAGLVTVTGK